MPTLAFVTSFGALEDPLDVAQTYAAALEGVEGSLILTPLDGQRLFTSSGPMRLGAIGGPSGRRWLASLVVNGGDSLLRFEQGPYVFSGCYACAGFQSGEFERILRQETTARSLRLAHSFRASGAPVALQMDLSHARWVDQDTSEFRAYLKDFWTAGWLLLQSGQQ